MRKKHQVEFDQHVAALLKKFGGSSTNDNENHQSLSVLRHSINEDNRVSENLGFEIEKFDLIIYDVRSPDEFKKIMYQIPSTCQFCVMKNAGPKCWNSLFYLWFIQVIRFLPEVNFCQPSQIVFLTYWGKFFRH